MEIVGAPATVGGMRTWLIRGVRVAAALLLVAQVVPYGRDSANPPVTQSINWNSPRTEQLAAGACNDCHFESDQLEVVQQHRSGLVADLPRCPGGSCQPELLGVGQAAGRGWRHVEVVQNGSMPPLQYKPLHAGARLSSAERDGLEKGLRATLAQDPPMRGRRGLALEAPEACSNGSSGGAGTTRSPRRTAGTPAASTPPARSVDERTRSTYHGGNPMSRSRQARGDTGRSRWGRRCSAVAAGQIGVTRGSAGEQGNGLCQAEAAGERSAAATAASQPRLAHHEQIFEREMPPAAMIGGPAGSTFASRPGIRPRQ